MPCLFSSQVMSSELDTVFRAMAIGQVPVLWKGKSFPSLKPLASYILDLLERLNMLQSWWVAAGLRAGHWLHWLLWHWAPPPAEHCTCTTNAGSVVIRLRLPVHSLLIRESVCVGGASLASARELCH